MAIRCGTMAMLRVVLFFVIVLATLGITAGDTGKKLIDVARDMDVPIPGNYCPGDVGEVTLDGFKGNLTMATKVAWNGQKRCWIKQTLDAGTITQGEMHEIMKEAMDVWNEKEYDDCLSGYFAPGSTTAVTDIDMVIWWDNKAVCGTDGLVESLWSWGQGAKGMSRDTLHFYKREDYCKADGSGINWYNPPGGSNIFKYSESKANFNDGSVCRDESGSGGINHRLPVVTDLTSTDLLTTARTIMLSEMKSCVSRYYSDFADGDDNDEHDGYLACEYVYRIKPSVNTTIGDVFPTEGTHYSTLYSFTYQSPPCDILDNAETNPDYSEFNSVIWSRDSDTRHCIYIVLDGFVKTEKEIENLNDLEEMKLEKDVIYTVTPFFYFEKGGANDIIIKIDR